MLIVILFLVGAFIYLRYASPIYQTETTILIKDNEDSSFSELAVFQDLGLAGGKLNSNRFQNETQILKSKSLTERVVKKLHLNVRYYVDGAVKSSEVYGDIPFEVKTTNEFDEVFEFYVEIISPEKFYYYSQEFSKTCLLYTSPSPRDKRQSRMPSSA